jgi:hemerythrin-like domain-containing protein
MVDEAGGAAARETDHDRPSGRLAGGTASPDGGRRVAAFLDAFSGRFHHEREERVPLRALVDDAELPTDRGRVYTLGREHAETEA